MSLCCEQYRTPSKTAAAAGASLGESVRGSMPLGPKKCLASSAM